MIKRAKAKRKCKLLHVILNDMTQYDKWRSEIIKTVKETKVIIE